MKQKLNTAFLGYWIGTALVLGVLVHIFAILSMPYLAPANAWSRLRSSLTKNHMKVLPPAARGQETILPMQATDVQYAVCRYDISNGPVLVTAEIPDDLWSVAIYTRYGDNFYLVRGSDLRLNLLRLRLFKKKKSLVDYIRPSGKRPKNRDELSVDVPEDTGIVVIRAPLSGRSFAKEAHVFLSNATCNKLKILDSPEIEKGS